MIANTFDEKNDSNDFRTETVSDEFNQFVIYRDYLHNLFEVCGYPPRTFKERSIFLPRSFKEFV